MGRFPKLGKGVHVRKFLDIFLFCSIFVLSIFLIGCDPGNNTPNDLGNVNNNNDNQTQEDWLFLDSINFNPTFSTYVESGKGFLLYDELDLDAIQMISDVDKYTVSIEISGDGVETETIVIGGGGKFEKFRFTKTGEYIFKVSGKTENENILEDVSFSIQVITGNRPDRVEFSAINSKSEEVIDIKGGDTYTFSAQVFSGEEEYIPSTPKDVYWGQNSYLAPQEYEITIGNIIYEEERAYDFRCFVTNNVGTKINIIDQKYVVKDNLVKTEDFPYGIYFSYGQGMVNGTKDISINAKDHPLGRYFLQDISAEYHFDNGNVQEIEISDSKAKEKAGLYISYDNENYDIYSLSDYDYRYDEQENRISNYFQNGVKYQFDPTKSTAKMYLARWREKKEGMFSFVETEKIEGTEIDLNLISETPSSIDISRVSGKHKNDDQVFSPGYKTFTKEPRTGNVSVYLTCDMDGDDDIEDEFMGKYLSSSDIQYFKLDVNTTGGNLLDYTVNYSFDGTLSPIVFSSTEKGNGELDQFFVGIREGTATITVKSRFSSLETSITVTVVNKIFEEAKMMTIHRYEDCYGIFSDLNFEDIIKIKEYRLTDYNKYSYNLRDLREDEKLEYRKGGTIISPEAVSYNDNGQVGQEISVYIQGTQKRLNLGNIYIVPEFDFTVNGQEYSLENVEGSSMIFEGINLFQSSSKQWFFGYVPYIQLDYSENPISFEITGFRELENSTSGEPRYSIITDSSSVRVYYKFYHTIKGNTDIYEVPILIIQKM